MGIFLEALYWLCLITGGLAAIFFGTLCLVVSVIFICANWSTVIMPGKIHISRFAGLRGVKWFDSDDDKNLKEYGLWIFGREKLVLQRRLLSISSHFPVFEINYRDVREDSELVISFFSGETIMIRKRIKGPRWNQLELSLSKFQETHYAGLVKRAEGLQTEIDRRFKLIIFEASHK